MKKLLTFILCLFGLAAISQEKGLLWKVTSPKNPRPSYLYGTIHITCDASLSESTKNAISETEQLFLELDMDDPAMQTAMMSQMTMKDGKRVKEMLSADDYTLLNNYLVTNIGVPLNMVDNMKPFMLSAMFYPKMISCPIQSVESELMSIASSEKMEILGLETVADQMSIFDAIPYETQLDELMKSVKDDFAKDKAETKKMFESYSSGDVNAMYKMALESENKITSQYDELLLDKRNRNWIPVIEAEIAKKPTFFGVGAAHLGGPNGVINLLRKAGYTVEAVR